MMPNRPIYLDISDEILKRINSDIYRIGSKLPSERDLSETLGVSRSSVREALHILERQKVIQSRIGGCRYVLNPQPQDDPSDSIFHQLENAAVADLLEARETLDDILITLACQRATNENMIEIDKAFHNTLNWDFPNAVILDADALFHLSIAKAAHNSVFESIYSANLEVFRQIRAITLQVPGRRKEMQDEHIEIYNAIKERDELTARLASRIHLRNIKRRYNAIQDKSLIDLQRKQ